MLTVKEALNAGKIDGDLGIEVEIESYNNFKPIDLAGWNGKGEGSLRNHGMEYVTRGPIPLDKVRPELTDLFEAFKKNKQRIVKDNHRTSTHMHVNVLDLTLAEYWSMVTYYWIVEGVLMPYCGPERVDNLHCYQLSNAEGMIKFVINELTKPEVPFLHITNDKIRYAGQNINCTSRFGSIEYRGMRGTEDVDVLCTWANTLIDTRNKTRKLFTCPADVVDSFFRSNPSNFLEQVYGDKTKTFVDLCGPSWRDKMEDNALLVSEYAYLIEDWDKWCSTFNIPKPKAKRKMNPVQIDENFNVIIPNEMPDWNALMREGVVIQPGIVNAEADRPAQFNP